MTAEEIRSATIDNEHIGMLSDYVLHGLPSMTTELQKGVCKYGSFRDEIAIIYSIAMKGKRIIPPYF